MTHSQTIAKVFTIICYILLVPTILFLLLSLISALFLVSPSIVVIPIIIILIGIVLLDGYRKHSRGNLNHNKIIILWLGTIGYNFLLLLSSILLLFQNQGLSELNRLLYSGETSSLIYFSILIWQVMAIVLSVNALWSEFLTNQNNGNVP